MPENTFTFPKPQAEPQEQAQPQPNAAVVAWYDADTDEKKASALKAYPELADIFSLAQTIKTSK